MGRILECIKQAGTSNPVFVLDDPERIPWILEEVAAWRM